MNSQEIANKLHETLKLIAVREADLKKIKSESHMLDQQLYDQMEAEHVNSIKIQGIEYKPKIDTDYKLVGKFQGSRSWDDIPDWFDWLRENGESGVIKMKESVHPQTRKKILKDMLNEGIQLPDWIEETMWGHINWNKKAIERLVENEKV